MARKNKTNVKNLVIILLVILLLALALGYAAFSDTLTITGTANARGTFDLEFQNANVVKSTGVNAENTKAVISADKNTLTVTVADLAYPGAGAEFTTDIVNVGSVPAKVEAVTPFDVEGSDALKSAIKINGLDAITTDHPTLASGEKCNIHFTVEWDKTSIATLGDADGNFTFGLRIEYTQKTDDTFVGSTSHSDGKTTTTNPENPITPPVTEPEEPTPDDSEGKITEIIKDSDIGKEINYSVTVNGITVDKWRIFSNDGENVKIITSGYLPQKAIPQAAIDAGLNKVTNEGKTTYCVNATSRDTLVEVLKTPEYWSELAEGLTGATAAGGPTSREFVMSWNANPKVNGTHINIDVTANLTDPTNLYIPYTEKCDGCEGYWLASTYSLDSLRVCDMCYQGTFSANYYSRDYYGIRPVVVLPTDVVVTVGDAVIIQK